ncbi:Zn-ribbon domain-containing OB-fold protein [Streptomyces tauricus]
MAAGSGVPARRFDLPEIDAFSRPYWDAAADGRLLLRRCGACGRAHHYPREFCPHCWSEAVTWERASGRATLYTWSVVHRNDLPPFGARTPYVAAVVDLAEGPRMMTEVVECGEADLRVGMALEVTFRAAAEELEVTFRAAAKALGEAEGGAVGGVVVPVFRPDPSSGSGAGRC